MVESGQKVEITFTVYIMNDIAYFALYLNLQGDDVDYSNSDTHVTYQNDGTTTPVDMGEMDVTMHVDLSH